MCGIAGLISSSKKVLGKEFYKAHLKIAHRGPDDEGFYAIANGKELELKGDDTVRELSQLPHIRDVGRCEFVLAHRRLSIIDLSTLGHQPFVLGKYVVVYNGEIYNYLEIKVELEELGFEFFTSSDTEVFITAFLAWGASAFNKFNGMWAAAIYDKETKKTTLTRDRFGVKPLYYSESNDVFSFSSEIKFITELQGVKGVNEQSVYQYLRYSETDYDENTMFEGVKQVLPGQYIEIINGQLSKFSYWGKSDLVEEKSTESIELLLKDAIGIRLRSDVTVGSLLSGGIDSSLLVGFIKKNYGLDGFKSYSAVFEEEAFSEKKYIEETAKVLDFTPNYIYPKAEDLSSNIDELIYIQELPFRSLSVLSQYLIYKEVANFGDVKVLLNGQGADEIFTGYTEHYFSYFLDLFLRGKFLKLSKEFIAFKKYKELSWLSAFSLSFKSIMALFIERKDKYKIFNKSFNKVKCESVFKSPLKNHLYRNLNFSALREYLRYEDKNSMRFSLESRLPFLDYRLVKKAFSLDSEEYIQKAETKFQLRSMGKSYLAEKVRKRRDKTGFTSPQELWQKNELKGELDSCFEDIKNNGLFNFIDTNSVVSVYDNYSQGKLNDWAFIWRIYCLYKWKKVWLVCEEDKE